MEQQSSTPTFGQLFAAVFGFRQLNLLLLRTCTSHFQNRSSVHKARRSVLLLASRRNLAWLHPQSTRDATGVTTSNYPQDHVAVVWPDKREDVK